MKISSLRLLKTSIVTTARLYGPVLARGWMALLFLHLIDEGAGQFFSYAMEYLRQIGREDLSLIAAIAGLEMVFSILWSTIWLLAIVQIAGSIVRREPSSSLSAGIWRFFNHLMIEQVRALASVLWRAPLLIVPALIQYVRLSFVPFVVLLDPSYERGEVDALQASRDTSRGQFWLLSFTLLASLIAPWLIEQTLQGDGSPWLWQNPIGVGLGWFLTLFINIASTVFLFALFRGIFRPGPNPEVKNAVL